MALFNIKSRTTNGLINQIYEATGVGFLCYSLLCGQTQSVVLGGFNAHLANS